MVWAPKDEQPRGRAFLGSRSSCTERQLARDVCLCHSRTSVYHGRCLQRPHHPLACESMSCTVSCGHFETRAARASCDPPTCAGPRPACLERSGHPGFKSRVALEARSSEVSPCGRTGSRLWWGPGSPRRAAPTLSSSGNPCPHPQTGAPGSLGGVTQLDCELPRAGCPAPPHDCTRNAEPAFVSLNFLTCPYCPPGLIQVIEAAEPPPRALLSSAATARSIRLPDSAVVRLAPETKAIWELQLSAHCLNSRPTWLFQEQRGDGPLQRAQLRP